MNITNSVLNYRQNYYTNNLPKSSYSRSANSANLFGLEEAAIKSRQKQDTDEKLVALANSNSKARAINQEANGEDMITQEQIDYLKSKYNIENMSGSDYKELMADLTEMNVISAKDAKGQFCRKISDTICYPQYEEPYSYSIRPTGDGVDTSMFIGNVLENLKYEFNLASHKLGMVDNNQVGANNAFQLLGFKDTATEERAMFGRIINVLELIKQ